MKIIWSKHASERQLEWQSKPGILKDDFENVLKFPQQIVKGDMDALVAQSRFREGLLRIPFVQEGENRRVLTVYWTSKIERYWKEGE